MAGVTFYTTTVILGSEMDDTPVVRQLDTMKRRTDILSYLRNAAMNSDDFVNFPNKLILFKELYQILGDENWEVRNDCIQLIADIIPHCGEDLDTCMEIVLPRLIPNMGHSKITVRRSTIQTLHNYMKHTRNVQHVLQAIVSYGLENDSQGTSSECTILSLPMLLTPEFDKENYTVLVQALARQLVLAEEDKQQAAFFSLQKVKQLVGEERFENYLTKLHPKIVQEYHRLLQIENNNSESAFLRSPDSGNGSRSSRRSSQGVEEEDEEEALEFGIVPETVMDKLNDENDWKARSQGADSLKHIVASLTDVGPLIPNLASFLVLLNRLACDVNFKITTLSLEIYKILIDKVKYRIRPHLHIVVNALSRHLADSKIVVRSGCIKALGQLMQCVSPMPVITSMTGNLQHKSSRMREETINLITAALLTFPSYEFDLLILCKSIAPMITDPKRKIRQAVLECLAVLSQALGPTRSSLLIEIVEVIQKHHQTKGIVTAVQARLARRILPKVTGDGLVEYSVQIPTSAGRRTGSCNLQGADIDWIMAGSGSVSSGSGSARADSERDTSSGTSRSSQPASFPSSPAAPRRILSPGRTKRYLPWEDHHHQNKGNQQRIRALSDGNMYVKAKTQNLEGETSPQQSPNVMDSMHLDFGSSWHASHSPPGTSQKQLYLQKLRYQTDKSSGKGSANSLGVSILPNKPKAVLEDNNSAQRGLLNRASNHTAQLNESSLASTWPLQGPPPQLAHSRRKVLDPIQGSQDTRESQSAEMPVPTKPTIVRSSSAHRHHKVPPIGLQRSFVVLKDDDNEPAWQYYRQDSGDFIDTMDSVLDLEIHDVSPEEIYEEKEKSPVFVSRPKLSHKPKHSKSSSPKIVKNNSSTRSRRTDYESSCAEEVPFGSKPVMVHYPSMNALKANSHVGTNGNNNNSIKSEEDDINIVGKGMLVRNTPNSPRKVSAGSQPATDPHSPPDPGQQFEPVKLSATKSKQQMLPQVQGIAMGNNFPLESTSKHENESEPDFFSTDYDQDFEEATSGEEEQQFAMSMSQSTRDRLLFKKQEIIKKAEQQQRRLRETHMAQTDDIEENDEPTVTESHSVRPKPPPNKPSFTRKTPTKSPPSPGSYSGESSLPSSKPSSLSLSNNENQPFKNPESALLDAQKALDNPEWLSKCEGAQMMSRLAKFHPDTLLMDLHNINITLLREVKNLRSSVSRMAIVAVGDLFTHMKKYMETDLDTICKVLLHKSGESNKFIQEDVEKALICMIENVNPQRAGLALILGGANHKNAAVRKLTAQLLVDVAEKLGPAKLLSGTKDITDKFLPTAAQFIMDGSPHTRYFGRKIFAMIIFHPTFETALQKHVQPNIIRNIKNVLESIKSKGPGEQPNDSSASRRKKVDPMAMTI